MIHRAGLPAPDLQVVVLDERGEFLGRADFGYRARKVLGEFDGRVKYRIPRGIEDPGDVLFREKLREDNLRAAGWTVVRWVWADLGRPDAVILRLRNALGLG